MISKRFGITLEILFGVPSLSFLSLSSLFLSFFFFFSLFYVLFSPCFSEFTKKFFILFLDTIGFETYEAYYMMIYLPLN